MVSSLPDGSPDFSVFLPFLLETPPQLWALSGVARLRLPSLQRIEKPFLRFPWLLDHFPSFRAL